MNVDLNALMAGAGFFILCGVILFVVAVALLIWFLVKQRPMKVSSAVPPRVVDTIAQPPAPDVTKDTPDA